MKPLQEEILDLLKTRAKERPDEYINPNFLAVVGCALYDYYGLEDDDVSDWMRDMWEL